MFDNTMADAQPEPQVRYITRRFQSPGQKALETGLFVVEERSKSRFAKELRSDDQIPVVADREPATRGHSEE